MITNFDLMWIHVKKLIDEISASHKSIVDERLYSKYCNAFDQLAEIIDSSNGGIPQEKLQEVLYHVKLLEERFIEEQKYIQDEISAERLKARAHSAYSHLNVQNNMYNKKS